MEFNIISSYTRKQALDDGEQIEISEQYPFLCHQFYKIPIFMTRTVWDYIQKIDQDITDSIFDILYMSIHSPFLIPLSSSIVEWKLYLPFGVPDAPLVTLVAECNAMDIDDPKPCVTIMYPEER